MNKGPWFVVLLLCLVVYSHAQDYWTLPRCRQCHRASSFEQCNNFAICGKSEACFVDQLITDADTVVYEAGCRAIEVCRASTKRKRGDLVACSKCCNGDDYCNDHLCGLKKDSNLTLCNSCDGRDGRPQPPQYPEDCAYLRQCAPTEACFSSTFMKDTTSLRHYSTCKSKKVCGNLIKYIFETYQSSDQAVGKRNAGTICAVCCGDEQCNKYACETTKKRIRYLNIQKRFNQTTLTEIPWSST